jgi:hypothetical protein
MAANLVSEIMYAPLNFQIPAAHAFSIVDLQTSGAIVPAFGGVPITPANVGTFSRSAVILGAYQNPTRKF